MTDFKYGEITEKQAINYFAAYHPERGRLINFHPAFQPKKSQ